MFHIVMLLNHIQNDKEVRYRLNNFILLKALLVLTLNVKE